MQLSSCGQKNMIRESSSSAIAVPSTSHTEGKLSTADKCASQKADATEDSVGKSSKRKKKKKKAKKQPKSDAKNTCLVNSSLDTYRNADLGSKHPLSGEKNELSGSKQLKSNHLRPNQAEHVFVNDTNNRGIGCQDFNDTLSTESDATVGSRRQISVPFDRLRNMDGEPDLSPSLGSSIRKLEPGHDGKISYSSRGQSEIKSGKQQVLESGYGEAAIIGAKFVHHSKNTNEGAHNKEPPFSLRKPESELDVSELGAYRSSMNGHLKIREVAQNKARFGFHDTLPREVHTDRVINNVKPEFERRDHIDNRMKSNRDGFWTRRPSEGAESSSYRNRVNQRSFNGGTLGESRSSVPFWRHQAADPHRTAHPWSKPSLSRRDEWLTDRGTMPSPRQVKNISPWEQHPDLRQNGMNRGFSHSSESYVDAEESIPQGQKGSPNGQRQNRGKSYEIPFRNTRKYLPEDVTKAVCSSIETMPAHETPLQNTKERILENVTNETYANVALNQAVPSSSVAPSVPSAETDMNSGASLILSDADQNRGACIYQDIGENLTEETVVPVDCKESSSTILTSNGAINNCDGGYEAKVATGLSGCEPLRSQVIDHVCNIVDAVQASCESRAVYEQVSRGLGNPLCEFEKFANAVAPVLRIPELSCQHDESTGSSYRNVAASSCKNINLQQLANVPLNALWEWYEEPSCFGVKVKLTECKNFPARDNVNSEYQAFFVPFLSGIQLFGWKNKSKTNYKDTDRDQKTADPLNCSSLSQPILSVLLPNPTTDNAIGINMLNQNHPGDIENVKFGSTTNELRHCDCDVELLYEFYEGESPPQRRPFAEKIVQLAGASSDGDTYMLTSVKIGELHPSSWFAVAWYPIYRIPDGTFRSTFLTYHSLSSLQWSRPTNSSQFSEDNTVTIPMVGFMSYNAQVKDWFSLTSCSSSKDDPSRTFDANPAEVLQDHLTKLDAVAVSMARGCTDQFSGFKHLDYNFFQNRRK